MKYKQKLIQELRNAAQSGNEDIVYDLISNNNFEDDIKAYALRDAAREGKLNIVKLLIEAYKVQCDDAIHAAASRGHIEVVRFLLTVNPNYLNLRDDLGKTILDYAVNEGHEELVNFLFDNFKNLLKIDNKDNIGLNVFQKSITEKSNLNIIKKLFELGVDLNQTINDYTQNKPIHLALLYGRADLAIFLIKHKVDINVANKNGEYPIHLLIKSNAIISDKLSELTSVMVQKKVDLYVLNEDYKTLNELLTTQYMSKIPYFLKGLNEGLQISKRHNKDEEYLLELEGWIECFEEDIAQATSYDEVSTALELELSNEDFKDFTFLNDYSNLRALKINNITINNEELDSLDHIPFEKLPNLRVLHIKGTKISNIEKIFTFNKKIQTLSLDNLPITSISGIGNLVNLRELSLTSTKISDISAIKNLIKLNKLNIQNCSVDNSAIDVILTLMNLSSLTLKENSNIDSKTLNVLSCLPSLKDLQLNSSTIDYELQNNILETIKTGKERLRSQLITSTTILTETEINKEEKISHANLGVDPTPLKALDSTIKFSSLTSNNTLNEALNSSVNLYISSIVEDLQTQNHPREKAQLFLRCIIDNSILEDEFNYLIAPLLRDTQINIIYLRHFYLGYWKGFENTLNGFKKLVSSEFTDQNIISYIREYVIEKIEKLVDVDKLASPYQTHKDLLLQNVKDVDDSRIASLLDLKEKLKEKAYEKEIPQIDEENLDVGITKQKYNYINNAEIIELNNEAIKLLQDKDFLKAREKFETLYNILIAEDGSKFITIITNTINNLGTCFLHTGNLPKAKAIYEEGLQLIDNAIDKDLELIRTQAHLLNNSGIVEKNLGNFKEALKFQQQALDIRKEMNLENLDIACSYGNIGTAYVDLGNFAEALFYRKKEVELKQKLYKDNSNQDLLIAYLGLGDLLIKDSAIEEAKEAYDQAFSVYCKLSSQDKILSAPSAIALSLSYANTGNINKAIEILNYALSQITEESQTKAYIYENLSNIYTLNQNFDEALKQLALAAKIYSSSGNNLAAANSFNSKGNIYLLAYKKKAIVAYQTSINLKENLVPRNLLELAIAYNNLGAAYWHFKDFDNANSKYEEALKTINNIDNNLRLLQEKVKFLQNLGNALCEKAKTIILDIIDNNIKTNKYEEEKNNYLKDAFRYLTQGLVILKLNPSIVRNFPPYELNIVTIFEIQKRFDQALHYSKQALKVFEDSGKIDKYKFDYIGNIYICGYYSFRDQKYEEAETYFLKMLEFFPSSTKEPNYIQKKVLLYTYMGINNFFLGKYDIANENLQYSMKIESDIILIDDKVRAEAYTYMILINQSQNNIFYPLKQLILNKANLNNPSKISIETYLSGKVLKELLGEEIGTTDQINNIRKYSFKVMLETIFDDNIKVKPYFIIREFSKLYPDIVKEVAIGESKNLFTIEIVKEIIKAKPGDRNFEEFLNKQFDYSTERTR